MKTVIDEHRRLVAYLLAGCMVLILCDAIRERATTVLYEAEHALHPEPWPTPKPRINEIWTCAEMPVVPKLVGWRVGDWVRHGGRSAVIVQQLKAASMLCVPGEIR